MNSFVPAALPGKKPKNVAFDASPNIPSLYTARGTSSTAYATASTTTTTRGRRLCCAERYAEAAGTANCAACTSNPTACGGNSTCCVYLGTIEWLNGARGGKG